MNIRSLGIAFVFVAGCAVGGASARFVVPPANAQQAAALTKWEYTCFFPESGHYVADTVANGVKTANASGEQGWEMIAGFNPNPSQSGDAWCFKRPKM